MGGRLRSENVNKPTTYIISDGKQTRVVHANRLRPRVQPTLVSASPDPKVVECWSPPCIEHEIRYGYRGITNRDLYPSREQKPPDWFRPQVED